MILYLDSYISDIPLIKSFVSPNEAVRRGCKNYTAPKKLDVAKYTLASYAIYPWSNVLIKYKLDNPEDYEKFDEFIRRFFPRAKIFHHRSDNQQKFKESMEILDGFGDEWIFYAPNSDHPIIAPDIKILEAVITKAKELKRSHQFVSAVYSHFSEFINLVYQGNPFNATYGKDATIIDEDENTVSILRANGDNSGVQIVHKELFQHWFCSKDLGDERIIRPENLWGKVQTKNQVMVIPKREICAHFDGYSHTIGSVREIRPEQVPPLFIPPGFFEKEIKIAFCHDNYREGWTNINPGAKKFSFQNRKYGTDLKIGLEDIPLFWKGHIKEIDINKKADFKKIEKGRKKYFETVYCPYKIPNKPKDFQTLKFYLSLEPLKFYLMQFGFFQKLARIKRKIRRTFIKEKNLVNNNISELDQKRIQEIIKEKKILKIHIGCGPRVLKHWINIDLHYEPYENYLKYYTDKFYPPEIRGNKADFFAMDVTKEKLPSPDNSVDLIFNEDFVEHLGQRDQIAFLSETLRVLKKGGVHRISTPNLLSSMRDKSNFSKGFEGVFFEEWDKHHHKNLFTPESLKEIALMVGYSEVKFGKRNQSVSKLIPLEYRPDPKDRPEDGNIFADLIK